MSATRSTHAAPRSEATGGSVPWLLAALVAASFADLFRLGYFGDDFIFLDASWRHSWGEVLLGQHGVWPWYRPLARELFFALARAAGAAGPAVGHALALGVLWFAADGLRRVLMRCAGPVAGTAATVLFLGYALTRFLAGWLAGFQDLLALAFTLAALRMHQERHAGLATACIALAPFAKETGLLALPLILLDQALGERRTGAGRGLVRYGVAACAAATVHVLVRATWPLHPPVQPVPHELRAPLLVMLQPLVPWTSPLGRATALTWVSGVLATCLGFALMDRAGRARPPAGVAAPAFLGAATLLSAAPAFTPAILLRDPVQARFFFPALPWACALAGWALARLVTPMALRVGVALVCGLLVWTGSARHVDLDAPAGWVTGPLGWTEGQRIEARTRRLEASLRALLANRPESLLVGYLHVPSGSWFQTGDGPATRVVLADPTVQAWFLDDAPRGQLENPRREVALIDYDPVERHGFVRLTPQDFRLLPLAVNALLEGRPRSAAVLASYRARADSTWLARYVSAASELTDSGSAAAFARALAAAPLGTTGGPPSGVVGSGDARADEAMWRAAAAPLSPDAHRAAADALALAQFPMLEALELTIAVELDSTRAGDALRLGRLLAPHARAAAQHALKIAMAPGAPVEVVEAARRELAGLGGER